MKKFLVLAISVLAVVSANAQHLPNSFFNNKGDLKGDSAIVDELNGTIRFQTSELRDDTLLTLFHRADDVVWARIVYRVIDMRYKQNYQLYFPTNSRDPQYRSLFKVILDAVVDGLPIYAKPENASIKPTIDNQPERPESVVGLFEIPGKDGAVMPLLAYDTLSQKLNFDPYFFSQAVRNQLKYLVQEVVFFDKHYSRLFTKLIAIAPLYSQEATGESIFNSLYQQIICWIVYDELRPYLAQQYIIPQGNEIKRVTFEDFFEQKLYTSYLIGDSNMFDRMFSQYAEIVKGKGVDEDGNPITDKLTIERELKREQQRVQDELMNFELDLWEY